MAKQISTSSYSSSTSLTVGTSYSQQASYGESYSFLATTSGGTGKLVILIQSSKTGSTATSTSNTPLVVGIVIGVGYFVVPWTLMFIIMFILWINKIIFPKRRQEHPRNVHVNNEYTGSVHPNQNNYNDDMQRAIYLSQQQNQMHPRGPSNASSNGAYRQYAIGSPVYSSNPNFQGYPMPQPANPPPVAISSVSNGKLSIKN